MFRLRTILFFGTLLPVLWAGPASAHSGHFGPGSMGNQYWQMPMMGPGAGWMMGGMMMDPSILSDDYVDRIGEKMAEHYKRMQEIASTQDKAARRKLVREQMADMYGYRGGWGKDDDGDSNGKSGRGYGYGSGMMGPGMMGPGMMGPGMMGPGMMGPGMMGPGTAGPGAMGPGYMGRGMMGPGYGGRGYGGPGMMGGMMMYPDRLSDEFIDRIGDHMAENFKQMQQIANTTDKAERRELLRNHFKTMREDMQELYHYR